MILKFNTDKEAFLWHRRVSVFVWMKIFAKTVVRERRIPFEITTERDTFYSSEHLATLERRVAEMKAGYKIHEHELIEAE